AGELELRLAGDQEYTPVTELVAQTRPRGARAEDDAAGQSGVRELQQPVSPPFAQRTCVRWEAGVYSRPEAPGTTRSQYAASTCSSCSSNWDRNFERTPLRWVSRASASASAPLSVSTA